MDKNNNQSNKQTPDEIQQLDTKEFDFNTRHPQEADTQVQSEEIRYENADRIYE